MWADSSAHCSDYKETMEIGEDANLVSPWPNKWPAEEDAPGFKQFMNTFFDKCHQLHLQVRRRCLFSQSPDGLALTLWPDATADHASPRDRPRPA